jgi:hypothetical protein
MHTDTKTHEGRPPQRAYRAAGLAALIVFALLLTAFLGRREFWIDEIVTAGHVASLDATRDAYHPRGYYLLLYAWKQVLGDSDLALRAFSIPWALLTFILLGAIGRRVLSPKEALLAQWMLALSPFAILYFRMARYFSMSAAVALLVVYCAVLVAQEGKWRQWLGLAASACLALNTDYLVAAMLAPLFAWLAVTAFSRRQIGRLLTSLLPGAVILALKAQSLLHGAGVVHAAEAGAGHASLLSIGLRIAIPAYSLAVGETTDPWRLAISVPVCIVMLGAFFSGLLWTSGRPGYALVRWAWPLSVAAVAVVLSMIARSEPLSAAGRSTLFAAPLAYLVAAAGVCRIGWRTTRMLALVVIFAADCCGILNYFTGRQFLNPGYVVPWRGIAASIQAREQPTDLVMAFYDSTISRYASFHNFTDQLPDHYPEKMIPLRNWPDCDCRLWLICRDRGSATARRLQEEAIAHLGPRADRVQVLRFMPLSPTERRFRSKFLRRQVENAYVKVYLFTPPGNHDHEPESDS